MADGTINFDTKINTSDLKAQIESVEKEINSLNNELSKLEKDKQIKLEFTSEKGADFGLGALKGAEKQKYEEALNEIVSIENREGEINTILEERQSKLATLKTLYDELKNSREQEKESTRQTKEEMAGVAQEARKVSKNTGEVKKPLASVKEATSGILKQFTSLGSMLKSRLKRMLISDLINNVRNGFNALLQYSPQLKGVFDDMRNSLAQLGGNFVSAFEPILSRVIPVITTLVGYLNTAIETVGKFFAMLSGRNYITKAVKGQKDYASAASASNKEMNKQLAGFDELNNLSDEQSSGGGAGGAGSGVSFEKETFEAFDIKEKIADAVHALNDAIARIDWEGLGQKVSSFITGILEAIGVALGEFDWMQFGEAIGTFLRSIDWSSIIADVFYIIGELIGGGLAFLIGFFDALFADIRAYLRETFAPALSEDGSFCLEGFLQGMWQMIQDIGTWINEHILKPFVEGFKKAFGIHSPSTVMEEFGRNMIEGLFEGLKGIWDRVRSIFENLKENITSKWNEIKTNAQAKWEEIKSALTSKVESIRSGLTEKFNNVKSRVVEIFNSIKSSVGSAWSAMASNIKSHANSIISAIEGMVNRAIDGINWMTSGLRGLGNSITTALGFGSVFGSLSHVSLPRLATGTNYVPQNMIAELHKGEAVVPKAFNENQFNNSEETNDLLRELIALYRNQKVIISAREIGQTAVDFINNETRLKGVSPV